MSKKIIEEDTKEDKRRNDTAIEDMESGHSKIIRYDINRLCYESYPCKHDITIMLDDGRTVYLCVSEKYAHRYVNSNIKFH